MKLVDLKNNKLKLMMTGGDILQEVPFIKTFAGYQYNFHEKAWYLPATMKNVNALLAMKWKFVGDAYAEILRPTELKPRELKEWEPPSSLKYPKGFANYQEWAVAEIKKRHDRAVLAFPPGSGKTLTSIGWLSSLEEGRTLIVCPAFLKTHWQRELKQWAKLRSVVVSGKTPYLVPEHEKIVIINYDILHDWIPFTVGMFDTVIFDESHALINRTSKRTKAASLICDNTKHVLFMTGTPIKSRPLQFWPVLNIIDKKMFKSEDYFKNRYCAPDIEKGFDLTFKGLSNEEELYWLLKHYVVYKSKEELLPDLPKKNRVIYSLDIADKKLRQMEEDAMAATGMEKDQRLKELSHTAYFYKKQFIYECIDDIMGDTGKCVVGAYHTDVLADLKEQFPEGVIISGSVPPEKRQALVDNFQKQGKGLILAQIQAAGLGFSMDTCHDTVMAEMLWTPGEMEQFEDRTHRRTTKADQVNYYYPVVSDTVEERMVRTLDEKARMASMALTGSKKEFFTNTTKEKIDIS